MSKEPAPVQKLLFICSKNQVRSLTAEKLFANSQKYQARSAGTRREARIVVTEGHIGWADIIFCMEKEHFWHVREKFPEALKGKKLISLHVVDEYYFMQPELVEELKTQLGEHLDFID